MKFSRDVLITLATVVAGQPIGDVHIQVLLQHYGKLGPHNVRRSFVNSMVRKWLQSLATNESCQQLWLDCKRRAASAPVDLWPADIASDFLGGLESLFNLRGLFDDAPLFAFARESVRDEKSQKVVCSDSLAIDPRVALAQEYVMQNFQRALSVSEVACASGLSTSLLAKLFRHQFGVGIIEWRDKQRIALAAELLRDSDLPIATIASHVGYDDALYFSRVFRRHMNAPPSAFRS